MKKQLYLILILLVGLPNQIYSQDFWEQLYFPDTARIRCITINNSQDIFIGTGANNSKGGLYRSVDMAQTWDLIYNAGDFDVHTVEINDENDIYIGNSGAFLVSINNGLSWQPVILPSYSGGWVTKILTIGNDTIFVGTTDIYGSALLVRSYDKGLSWDSLFATPNKVSQYVSDIIKTNTGEMYISLMAYMDSMGGVYKSTDNGDTWEFAGLFNHMVSSLAYNSSGDVFAGVWGWSGPDAYPGLYVLRNGQSDWDTLIWGPQVSDVVVNSEGDIYFTSAWPLGVVRSLDNGETFELINEGLSSGLKDNIISNNEGFLYVTSLITLDKSINTTVSVPEKRISSTNTPWLIYPNPVKDVLNIKPEDDNHYSGDITINIFNTTGKLMISKKILLFNGIIKTDFSSFTSGIYVIEIAGNKSVSYFKIIKK